MTANQNDINIWWKLVTYTREDTLIFQTTWTSAIARANKYIKTRQWDHRTERKPLLLFVV